MFLALVANFFLISFAAQSPGSGETSIGEAEALGIAQNFGWHRLHGMLFQLELHVINFFELVKEPGIDRGHFRDLLDGVSLTQRVEKVLQTLRVRRDQSLRENLR